MAVRVGARVRCATVRATTRDLGTPTDDPRSHDRDSYSIVNLLAGLSRGRYEASLFVTNLLNSDEVLWKSYQNFAPGSAYEMTIQPPRVVGAGLRATF